MRWKPWVIPAQQPGHSSTTPGSCEQSKVTEDALSVLDKLKHSTGFRAHPGNLVRRWGQKHDWKHDWKIFSQRQNLRKHTSSMVLARRGHLACPETWSWTHTEFKGWFSGQSICHGTLWVLTLN